MRNILFLIFMISTICVHAQDKVEETKQKVKNRTENRIDGKIDNAIDGGLNKIEGLFKRKKKKNRTSTNSNNPFNTSSNAAVRPLYEFGSNMKCRVVSYRKGDENNAQEMNFQYLFPKQVSDNYLGMKMEMPTNQSNSMEGMMTILENSHMLMFMDQGGAKFVTTVALPVDEDVKEDQTFDTQFKKTGNTLEVLGYTCDEYTSESGEFNMRFWIAPTMQSQAKSMKNVFLSMNKSAKVNVTNFPHPEMGMVLQMESINVNTQDKFVMQATELNLNQATSFSTTGYKKLGINLGGKGN